MSALPRALREHIWPVRASSDEGKALADMFVARDTDSYDPGVAVGEVFPAIRARYQDREITDVGEVKGPRGLVIYVNRSADW